MPPVWRTRLFILFLALVAAGMGYLYFTQRLTPEERLALQATPTPVVTPTPGTAPLSVDFAEMLAVPYDLDSDRNASQAAMLDFISNNIPGMVVLFGEGVSTTSAQQAVQTIANDVGEKNMPLIAVDHEGGTVQRLSGTGFTRLPTWRRMCTQTSEERTTALETSAAELSQVGVDVVFAPVIDVADSNAILRDRICSGDPELVSEAGKEYVQAFEKADVFPVLKHFPGLGSATVDTHTAFGSVTITQKDTQPFKSILDIHPDIGVMTAHIGVENQTTAIACSLSAGCIRQLYDLYPEVIVFTDALEMDAALYNSLAPDTPKSLEMASIEAVLAGSTVLVYGPGVSVDDLNRVLSRMKLEYTNSSEFRVRVNESYEKIQKLKQRYSLNY